MSEERTHKTLVLGIGNESRQDDGLGWRFLEFLESSHMEGLDLEYRYQLQVEDAECISRYGRVLFVDATHEHVNSGYYIRPCPGTHRDELGSHALRPETVVYLCERIFKKFPKCLVMGIAGSQWELKPGLTEHAERNLCNAQRYFKEELFNYL